MNLTVLGVVFEDAVMNLAKQLSIGWLVVVCMLVALSWITSLSVERRTASQRRADEALTYWRRSRGRGDEDWNIAFAFLSDEFVHGNADVVRCRLRESQEGRNFLNTYDSERMNRL